MKRILLLTLVACGASSTPAAQSPAPSPTDDPSKIDSIVETALREFGGVGVSVAVARGDTLLVAKGYGFADVVKRVPATTDTVYRIGSVTKQFTAVAILQLAERGQLALTDDLRKYLPDYPKQTKPITIEHLLTHTSGIPSYTSLPNWSELGKKPLTRDEVVALFASKPLDFEPGERWVYSSSNYYLLGLIIERITKQPYADVIRERLLKPAGMAATDYCNDAMPRHAVGYRHTAGTPQLAEPLDMAHPYAAGALCSTVLDLLAWQRALDGGKLLSPALLARMRTAATLASGKPVKYGYGVFVDEIEGHLRIDHGGGINGFTAGLSRYPSDDLTIVVLTNTEHQTPVHIEARIARHVMKLPDPAVRHELTAARRARYIGTYRLTGEDADTIRVFAEGNKLRAQVAGQPATTLVYQGKETFVLEVDINVKFVFAADGDRAAGFTVHHSGTEIEAKRVE